MGDLSPFDFFRQETSNPDVIVRTEAMNKILVIVSLMGPERVRNEMLPYLQTKLEDFDQVILAMGNKLGDMVPYLGGPSHATVLIEALEVLCGTEEITARSAAALSTSKIIAQLNPDMVDQVNDFFEMFKRMSNEEAGEMFYSRVSSCYIVAELYRVMNEDSRPALREIYTRLVIDELPMVRRAAALVFVQVAANAEPEVFLDEYLQVTKSFATDEYPTVRVIGTENLLPYLKALKVLNSEDSVAAASELLPIVKAAVEDPSWRIKLAISKDFGAYADVFTPDEVASEIFPAALRLIQDQEPDVRANAMKGMTQFLGVIPQATFVAEFMNIALHLLDDPYLTARELLAEVCIDVAAKAGPDALNGPLKDAIMRLVMDEDPMVRLRILKKIPMMVVEVPALCTALTEEMKKMVVDTNWRIRKELAIVMPAVLTHMGQDYYADNFMAPFLTLLRDGVGEVRLASAESLPKLTTSANAQWVHEKLFPAVRDLSADEYLLRMSMISALQGLMAVEDLPERFRTEVLALLVNAAKDSVPNIRLRAAQALGTAGKFVGEELGKAHVRPILTDLTADKDRDVQYFANQSIKFCA